MNVHQQEWRTMTHIRREPELVMLLSKFVICLQFQIHLNFLYPFCWSRGKSPQHSACRCTRFLIFHRHFQIFLRNDLPLAVDDIQLAAFVKPFWTQSAISRFAMIKLASLGSNRWADLFSFFVITGRCLEYKYLRKQTNFTKVADISCDNLWARYNVSSDFWYHAQ